MDVCDVADLELPRFVELLEEAENQVAPIGSLDRPGEGRGGDVLITGGAGGPGGDGGPVTIIGPTHISGGSVVPPHASPPALHVTKRNHLQQERMWRNTMDGRRRLADLGNRALVLLEKGLAGEDLARPMLGIVEEARDLGFFTGREHAEVDAALHRWRTDGDRKWDEVIGQKTVTDPAIITWQHVVNALYSDLADTRELDENEKKELEASGLPVGREGKHELAVWWNWTKAARRLSDSLLEARKRGIAEDPGSDDMTGHRHSSSHTDDPISRRASWLHALEVVRDELDSWGDFEQSEITEEYFPDPITGNKTPGVDPHPVWLAIVELERFYPKERLPKPSVALDAWADLCKYSREHGSEDRVTQRDKAVNSARILRQWVCDEIVRITANTLATSDVGALARTNRNKTTPIVFISSTVEDLKAYRDKAKEAAIEAGFMPRMQEYFPASGHKPPLEKCLEEVSGCDVLVVIVAHRYGWVPDSQQSPQCKSITWLECEKAKQDGIEVLPFVVDENYAWPRRDCEEHRLAEVDDTGNATTESLDAIKSRITGLRQFKAWIDKHHVRCSYTTAESLYSEVLAALYAWKDRNQDVNER
ncbi:MAG TPA: hypothetical protein DD670_18340 [Planctomycetaceae bacterium]|nr:hypothetical protein [Planctomycetaceae bacterium]